MVLAVVSIAQRVARALSRIRERDSGMGPSVSRRSRPTTRYRTTNEQWPPGEMRTPNPEIELVPHILAPRSRRDKTT